MDASGTSLWVPMEFLGSRSKALRGCGGDSTHADGMARRLLVARAVSAHNSHERLPAVQCIHVWKSPQGAVLSAQNRAFFNLSPDMKQGLRRRSLQGFVAQPEPTIGRAAP